MATAVGGAPAYLDGDELDRSDLAAATADVESGTESPLAGRTVRLREPGGRGAGVADGGDDLLAGERVGANRLRRHAPGLVEIADVVPGGGDCVGPGSDFVQGDLPPLISAPVPMTRRPGGHVAVTDFGLDPSVDSWPTRCDTQPAGRRRTRATSCSRSAVDGSRPRWQPRFPSAMTSVARSVRSV